MYLSKKNRLAIVTLLALCGQIEELKETDKLNEWFGKKGASWVKQAGTLMLKAFEEGLATQLTDKERLQIHKEVQAFATIKNVELPLDVAYDLADKAIGKTCVGCTITKYKQCELYEGLEMMNIPPACEEKGVCPYRQ